MNTIHRPHLTAMSREELLQHGGRGHRESMEVSLELIRRHRETSKWRFLTEGPDNVVPFRRVRRRVDEGGSIA
jgi:hypothetical protein